MPVDRPDPAGSLRSVIRDVSADDEIRSGHGQLCLSLHVAVEYIVDSLHVFVYGPAYQIASCHDHAHVPE